MTEREQAAFHAGIRHSADLALIAALSLEVRDDARHLRQQAAVAALRALAEGLKAQASSGAETVNGVHGFAAAPAPNLVDNVHEVAAERLSEGGNNVTPLSDQRHAAIASGYSGDACTNCQNFTMRRAGTCLSCDTCGSTTGCS